MMPHGPIAVPTANGVLTRQEMLDRKRTEKKNITVAIGAGAGFLMAAFPQVNRERVLDLVNAFQALYCAPIDEFIAFLESAPDTGPMTIGYPPVSSDDLMKAQERVEALSEELEDFKAGVEQAPKEARIFLKPQVNQMQQNLKMAEEHRNYLQKALESQEDKSK